MNFFTSDVHFADIITMKVENRPFKNINQYDHFIIKNFNKTAKKGDTIYVIGDLFDCDNKESVCWKKSIKYIKKIKANIVLIMGNNEDRIVNWFFDGDFEKFSKLLLSCGIKKVVPNMYLNLRGKRFYLVHQPKDRKLRCTNLFGHLHRAGGMWTSFGLNVAVDHNNFDLLSEDDIFLQLKIKDKYFPTDENFRFN